VFDQRRKILLSNYFCVFIPDETLCINVHFEFWLVGKMTSYSNNDVFRRPYKTSAAEHNSFGLSYFTIIRMGINFKLMPVMTMDTHKTDGTFASRTAGDVVVPVGSREIAASSDGNNRTILIIGWLVIDIKNNRLIE